MMQDRFDERFANAIQAAKNSDAIEPRAKNAFYDAKHNRIVVELKSGCIFMFPTNLTQILSEANIEQLESVAVTPSGEGLYFEKLDEDFSLPNLMIGVFGSKKWMSKIKKKDSLNNEIRNIPQKKRTSERQVA